MNPFNRIPDACALCGEVGGPMVACETCENWYHTEHCAHDYRRELHENTDHPWYCGACDAVRKRRRIGSALLTNLIKVLRELRIRPVATPDETGRIFGALTSPTGRAPTAVAVEQFWNRTGQQFDLARMIGYIDRHYGFQDVFILKIDRFASIQLLKGVDELVESRKLKLVRRAVSSVVVSKLGLTEEDLRPVEGHDEGRWRTKPLLWLILPANFAVSNADTANQLRSAEDCAHTLLLECVDILWGSVYSRQELWRKIRVALMSAVQTNLMPAADRQSTLRKVSGRPDGAPGAIELTDLNLPGFIFGVGMTRGRRIIDRQISNPRGVLKYRAALRYDGSRVDLHDQSVDDEVALCIYRLTPPTAANAEPETCIVCGTVADVEEWKCACGKWLCRNCLGYILASSICLRASRQAGAEPRCPQCRRTYDGIPELHDFELQVRGFINDILLLNNMMCPLSPQESQVPVYGVFEVSADTVHTLLMTYSGLNDWATMLRRARAVPEAISDGEVIRSFGQHLIEPLNPIPLPADFYVDLDLFPDGWVAPEDEAPADGPAEEPPAEPVGEAAAELEHQPVDEAANPLAAEAANLPADGPAGQLVDEPARQGADEPAGQLADDPARRAADEPAGQRADEGLPPPPAAEQDEPPPHNDIGADDDDDVPRPDEPIPEDWFSTTDRGNRSVWIGNRQWRRTRAVNETKSRYRCSGCTVSLLIETRDGSSYLVRAPRPHRPSCTAAPDPAREERTRLRRRVQEEVARGGNRRDLVAEIVADHGNAYLNTNGERNLNAARYRAGNAPGDRPRRLDLDRRGYFEDFIRLAEQHAGRCRGTRGTGQQIRFLLYSNAENPMLIWATDHGIAALNRASGLLWDGTFYVAPPGWEQLWTGVAEIDGHYVPTYFVLMTRRTQQEYERALLQIRTDLAQRQLFHIVSTLYYITDYEIAMRNALVSMWEIGEEQLRGCLWHLGRCWVRNMQDEMAAEYRAPRHLRTDKGRWLHRICGIACLPVDDCLAAWQHLQQTAPQGADIDRFIAYMEANYVGPNAVFPPIQWCAEPSIDATQRTTNPVEGLHSDLNHSFTTAHPPVKGFCEKLKIVQSRADTRLNSVMDGTPPRESRSKEQRRLHHYQDYRAGRINLDTYLERISELSGIRVRDL
ncbi:hypothetical protein FOZ61_000252 [Perkinsus olseni]|uniref:Zinc finger PHD-type domain-containing protein n=1 Tax=Perkinsus olseni TaxID=32597 RepID=A0A7J6KVJ5_PEROL|nr:hypothetical protein FOZ61_000252 [Perkinsus olseni]